jgi:hypothetical protein
MSDDGIIRIGTEVDISGLKANMAEAAATVKTSTSQMESAYQQLATTTAEYAVSQANLRAVIRQLVDGQVPYTLAVKALTPALMESSDATKALGFAKASLAKQEAEATAAIEAQTVALTSNALAQTTAAVGANELSAATGNLTSKFYSAQGASAMLSGRIPQRAFEKFLSVIPLVGDALALAFPVIGAIALIEVIGEGISKIRSMQHQAEEAAEKIDLAWRRMSDEIRSSNDSLLTESDRLREELDKLVGRPSQNGMAIAFDEAASAADKLGASIDRDIDKMRQLVELNNKTNSIGFWASFWSGKAETEDTQKTIDAAITGIQEMNDSYARTVKSAADSGDKANLAQAEEARLAGLEDAYAKATDAIGKSLDKARHSQESYDHSGKTFGKDQTANIKLLQGALDELALDQQNIGLQYRNEVLQQKVTPAREAHNAGVADDKAAREALKGIEDELDKLAAKESAVKGHGLTAGEGMAFWGQYLTTFKDGSEQAKHVMEQYVRNQEEFHKQLEAIKKGAKKSADEDIHMESLGPELNKWILEQGNDILGTGEKWKQYKDELTKSTEIEAQAKEAIDLATISANQSAGSITALAAAKQRAAVHTADYTVKLAALGDELQRLKKEAAENNSIHPATGNNTDPKNAAQQQQIKNQIAQLTGQMKAAAVTDQAAITQQLSSPFLKAFDQINSSWLQVQNRMMFSTRNLSLEFAKMGQNILISIVDNMEKAALVAIEKEVMMTIAHSTGVTERVATDASGAAASTAISKSSALEQGIQAAKLAFKNTYATVSQWPIVGPILAPPLASAAFVAVAAFEDGTGYVPRDGMAYLHEGEAVVPAPTIQELRGSDGGGDVTINQHNQWNTMTDRTFQRQLDRHASHVAAAVKKHLRQTGNARSVPR